jgi:hypothetical protein
LQKELIAIFMVPTEWKAGEDSDNEIPESNMGNVYSHCSRGLSEGPGRDKG